MTGGAPKRMATLLHVVDYTGSDPQTARLVEEVLARLPADDFAIGIVSSGTGLERAHALAGKLTRPIEVIDTPALIHRFAVALGPDAEFTGSPTYEVLGDTFNDPDVVWFPQLQFHLPAHRGLAKIVAGIPDVSLIEMAEFLAKRAVRSSRRARPGWRRWRTWRCAASLRRRPGWWRRRAASPITWRRFTAVRRPS